METAMATATATAMDFSTLSRRELQALCKLNGVRANMTNLAMAETLQSLPSVDGIDQIGTTLCLPTPGKSAMKSVLKAAAATPVGEDQQQQGSPLPRGRRVSVKSPEAIRMDVEDGEDEMKRDLVKEIVRTPGVALRSTSRRARATPAPLPTPAAGTVRRSQRSAARNTAAALEEEASTAKGTTKRSARSKSVIEYQEEEVAAVPEEEKVNEVELKGVVPDEKCDDPEEEEVILEEGNNKAEEEPQQDEEVVSSVVPIGSALISDKCCDDSKVEEEATKTQEVAGIGKELEPVNAEKSAPSPTMEDSPILGVLSKAETSEPAIKEVEDASVGDGEGFGRWSPVKETTNEIIRATEKLAPAAVTEDEKEGDLHQEKEVAVHEMPQADLTDGETTEEDDLDEEEEMAADEMPQADLKDDVSSEEDETDGASSEEDDIDDGSSEEDDIDDGSSEEDDMDEEEEGAFDGMQKADLTVVASSEEIDSGSETDEESDECDSTEVIADFDEEMDGGKVLEAGEDGLAGEEDDFSEDLSPDFDNAWNFSDAETESDSSPAVLEGIHAAAASSAAKTAVKESDHSAITEKLEISSEGVVAAQQVNTIVKSLVEFSITKEAPQQAEVTEAKKQQFKAENVMSLRKLKAKYKEELIAAKEARKQISADEGKRLPLEELSNNAGVDC